MHKFASLGAAVTTAFALTACGPKYDEATLQKAEELANQDKISAQQTYRENLISDANDAGAPYELSFTVKGQWGYGSVGFANTFKCASKLQCVEKLESAVNVPLAEDTLLLFTIGDAELHTVMDKTCTLKKSQWQCTDNINKSTLNFE